VVFTMYLRYIELLKLTWTLRMQVPSPAPTLSAYLSIEITRASLLRDGNKKPLFQSFHSILENLYIGASISIIVYFSKFQLGMLLPTPCPTSASSTYDSFLHLIYLIEETSA